MKFLPIMRAICKMLVDIRKALKNEVDKIDAYHSMDLGEYNCDCICDYKDMARDNIRVDYNFIYFIKKSIEYCINDNAFMYRYAQDYFIQGDKINGELGKDFDKWLDSIIIKEREEN
jgi:hypothetical protein